MSLKNEEFRLVLGSVREAQRFFGFLDANVRVIESVFQVDVNIEGDTIVVRRKGKEDLALVERFLTELVDFLREGAEPTPEDLRRMATSFRETQRVWWKDEETIFVTASHKPIRAKTPGQLQYVRAVRSSDITFCIGPAGTGKTYLAMAMACAALQKKEVARIVLVRPAVEAGESLGYLPGDLKEKIEPYLRPLYDALYEMLSPERFQRYTERGIIEVAPLAYMRGRTLNDSFIVLDEAQNTTSEQMKMFLTRMGFGSKVVVTGDITQVDLPPGKRSGLIVVQEILRDIPGITFVYLTEKDVVRHHLVQKIILAYERFEANMARR
ncbi:PhoH family protein [Candidatus Caldatribacterium sp. SIUC1]|uniref:PhoH family protein n=1 Tax=Candidatus Caldatribacterium sp. SIUC1 TaxID=3418365 RepID=UPI003F690693